MRYLYTDLENLLTKEIRLKKMTLRQYLAAAPILGCGWAEDDEPVRYMHADDPNWLALVDYLQECALDADVTIAAHNASYDVRDLRFGWTTRYGAVNMPQPQQVHCTLELAHAAFPNQPGGYGLKKLAQTLGLSAEKIELDLSKTNTRDELADYCIRDVELCREIHRMCIQRLHPVEIKIAELANQVRELHFVVRTDRVKSAMISFSAAAAAAVNGALTFIDRDGDRVSDDAINAFGWIRKPKTDGENDPGLPTSVKSAQIKNLLLDRLGFDTKTITYKKNNPEHLRQNPEAAALLKSTSEANKAFSYKRRTAVFDSAAIVDVELGYHRAHTGRYSSPSTGKGLNLHNCVEAETLILTNRGWVPIVDVTTTDRVWDGVEFVPHDGVTYEGERECCSLLGVRITPEHPVWNGKAMLPVQEINNSWQQVRCLAAGVFSLTAHLVATSSMRSVSIAELSSGENYLGWALEKAFGAGPVTINSVTDWLISFLTTISDHFTSDDIVVCTTGTEQRVTDDFYTKDTTSAEDGKTLKLLSPTAKRLTDGTTCPWTWTVKIPKVSTNLEISVSLLLEQTREIVGRLFGLSTGVNEWSLSTTPKSISSNTFKPTISSSKAVFDLRDCGPRHRFQAGPLLIANCPKRNPAVAKPIRQMFELPEGLVFVRGDFAGVEYRHAGWLTHCEYVEKLYFNDIFADAYAAYGKESTNMVVTKEDPARQVFKAGVLGLVFIMGVGTWMSTLALLISDPVNEVTLADLDAVCTRQRWTPVADRWVKAHQTKIGCPWQVAAVAYHTRNAFHRIHPEFQRFAKWLMYVVQHCASALDPEYELAECYKLASAPDPDRLLLCIDNSLSGRSIRARCGPWPAFTVAWRDIGMRDTPFGFCLASVQAGDKGYRKITPNTLIENVVQASARNSLCAAKLELERRGWPYLLSVHDEILIVCDQKPATVLKARQDLLEVTGPGNKLGWDYATVINPAEVNVSKSLYEQDMATLLPPIGEKMVKGKMKPVYPSPAAWWCKLAEGDATLLDHLP